MHSRVLFCFLSLGLGLGLQSVSAQCTSSNGEAGFADVVFEPDKASFSQLLPFDVPVRICAEVPAGTTRATVKYAANLRRRGPLDVDPVTCEIKTVDPKTGNRVPWSPELARVPTTATVEDGGTSKSISTARWLTDRLEAERYYVFCFGFEKKATEDELAAFRRGALVSLGKGIARIGSANLTVEQTQDICLDLRKNLLDITGTDRVLSEGSIFDCDLDRVSAFATQVSRGVLEPQRSVQQILVGVPDPTLPVPSLGELQRRLRAELATIQGQADLAAALDLLDRQGLLDSAIAARVKSLCEGCNALVGSAATSAERLALGEDAAQVPAPPLDVTSPPSQAAAMAQGYGATAKTLRDLDGLIAFALGNESGPLLAAGLTAEQRAALTALTASGGPVARAKRGADSLARAARTLDTQLAARAKALADVTDTLVIAARTLLLADASTLGNFVTNQRNYIAVDAGFVWAPELDEIVPYLGTNLYLRPVNKQAPLSTLGSFGQTFSRRFSFTLGLTGSSIADSNEGGGATRDDLFASQSLLLGAGLRLTDSMRLGAGGIVFRRDDPSPLIDEKELYASWYLTLSFDIDVVSFFARTFRSALPSNTTGGPQ